MRGKHCRPDSMMSRGLIAISRAPGTLDAHGITRVLAKVCETDAQIHALKSEMAKCGYLQRETTVALTECGLRAVKALEARG